MSSYSVQYSVHAPNEFIRTHLNRLLPQWSVPVLSVLVVLQKSQVTLLAQSAEIQAQKQQLRQQFFWLGDRIAHQLQHLGYEAEIFDPKTGLPTLSLPGESQLDDVAVVRSALGYPLTQAGDCLIILHPIWGSAVYPSVLMSSAAPHQVEKIVDTLINSNVHLPS
ncbi:MAG: methylmalonic aciduria and homocystinuria type D protein [Cyanothece sp. SIO1E1]|nr:methylmalonic aciduria and homocystinuria type D protein [Cyanothece sp. SIO1E1]